MDIGHDIMGTIIINSYAFGGGSSVSAVSDLYSKDNSGNGSAGGGGFSNSRITLTTGTGNPQHDLETQPVFFPNFGANKISFNANFTGTASSIAWSITEQDNFQGLITGISPSTGSSAQFEPVFTVTNNLGANAEYEVTCVVTNAGGATSQTFPLSLIFA